MKWNGWDVASDGTLSRNGISRFSIVRENGTFDPAKFIKYRLVDAELGKIEAIELDIPPLLGAKK